MFGCHRLAVTARRETTWHKTTGTSARSALLTNIFKIGTTWTSAVLHKTPVVLLVSYEIRRFITVFAYPEPDQSSPPMSSGLFPSGFPIHLRPHSCYMPSMPISSSLTLLSYPFNDPHSFFHRILYQRLLIFASTLRRLHNLRTCRAVPPSMERKKYIVHSTWTEWWDQEIAIFIIGIYWLYNDIFDGCTFSSTPSTHTHTHTKS